MVMNKMKAQTKQGYKESYRLLDVIAEEEIDKLPETIRDHLMSNEGYKMVSPYHSDRRKALRELREKGFKAMAWTPNIRSMYYHKDKEILVVETEGDIDIYTEPTREFLDEQLQHYPKGEVSLGEKYDSRFNSGD